MLLAQTSQAIAAKMAQRGIIANEDQETYAYCAEVTIILGSTIISMLALAIISRTILSSAIYITVFLLLRTLYGGYHADTPIKCYFLTIISYIIFLVVTEGTSILLMRHIGLLFLAVENLVIFLLAPIDTPNKRFSAQERRRFRKNGLIGLACFDVGILLAIITDAAPLLIYSGILGGLNAAISLMAGYIANKRQGGAEDEECYV